MKAILMKCEVKEKGSENKQQIPITNVRPIVVSIDPRTSQMEFARAIRSNFPVVKIKHIRELKNNTDFLFNLRTSLLENA